MKTLPERWSKFLLTQPETGMGYHVTAITLRDGQVIEDVAIVDHCVVAEVRGQPDIDFNPAEITGIQITHRKWDFMNASPGEKSGRQLNVGHQTAVETPASKPAD
jgi:hypothetical protein